MRIFLCGFMGSGKTTLLKRLQNDQFLFIDLDEEIEKHQNSTVGEIIRSKGLNYFRSLESSMLEEILKSDKVQIVALGGGSLSLKNIKEITTHPNKLVWLNTPVADCINHILADPKERPLAYNIKSLKQLNSWRQLFYEKSNVVLDTSKINSITLSELFFLCYGCEYAKISGLDYT